MTELFSWWAKGEMKKLTEAERSEIAESSANHTYQRPPGIESFARKTEKMAELNDFQKRILHLADTHRKAGKLSEDTLVVAYLPSHSATSVQHLARMEAWCESWWLIPVFYQDDDLRRNRIYIVDAGSGMPDGIRPESLEPLPGRPGIIE